MYLAIEGAIRKEGLDAIVCAVGDDPEPDEIFPFSRRTPVCGILDIGLVVGAVGCALDKV